LAHATAQRAQRAQTFSALLRQRGDFLSNGSLFSNLFVTLPGSHRYFPLPPVSFPSVSSA
jgi:hypothetical protein